MSVQYLFFCKPIDRALFLIAEIVYSFDRICNDIRDISYLYKGITFSIKNIDTNVVKTFCAAGGIKDFVKDNVAEVAAEYNLREQAAEAVMRKIYKMAKENSEKS